MAFASLSIYGLWAFNSEIFDNLVLPAGVDGDQVKTAILTECSDFCLLYPNYDFMKMLIGVWSQKELRIWEKMLESETIEYNPIENYDRHESITRNVTSKASGESNSETDSNGTGTTEETGGKTAYDTDNVKDVARTRSAAASTSSGRSKEAVSNESAGTENVVNHTHGNIGVTTAQQMIQGFREVSNFCTVDFIVQSFKDRFCIQVY